MKKFLILLLLLPLLCWAQTPEPLKNTYVNDFAGVLNASQIQVLNDSILSLEKRSSVQLAIVLVSSLPEGMSIEDYALKVGRNWHVGNANNGLVYVAAIVDRKQRLEVANGLQGDIPDIKAHEITESIKPFFRNTDYYGGLQEMIKGINNRVDPVIKKQLALAQIEQDKISERRTENIKTFFLWLGTIAIGFFILWLTVLRGYWRRKREARELEEERESKRYLSSIHTSSLYAGGYSSKKSSYDDYTPPAYSGGYSGGSSSSSGSSDSGSNSSYGDWGSGSSGSDSSSGFSGGGSSNDW